MKNKIKFSVIGFGRIGKRHSKIIYEYEFTDLISITDVAYSQFEESNNLDLEVDKFTSIEEFLEKDNNKSDIVCIATPNGTHTDYAVRLLNAGYHVLIEKPMGLSQEECLRVIGAQETSNKRVFVVKQNRYSPLQSG